MFRTLLSVAFLLCWLPSRAQDDYLVEGKVIDARTGKGISALIHYSSMPTGSISGDFNDSTFSFQIFGTARYQVSAEMPGYLPRTVIVDPSEIGTDKKVKKNISLLPEGETMVLSDLIFPQGQATIDKRSHRQLDEVAEMMRSNPRMRIQLEGHTDNIGSPEANLALSRKRVNAVKKYIVARGIRKDRIKTKAFGGSQPIAHEATAEARAANRRVEMRVLED